MRTKQEEHKLIETFDHTTVAIKTESRPLFAELLKATEEYQKSLAQTAFSGNRLTEVMKRVVAISPDPEMNKGLDTITEVIGRQEKFQEDLSKFILSSILLPMRQQQDDEKKSLPEFIKRAKAQRKASEKAVKDAEAAASKAGKKGGSDLQEKIAEIGKKEEARQQELSDQLKKMLQFQRTKFCLYVKVWSEAFALMQERHDDMDKIINSESELLKKLGESAEEVAAAQMDLVRKRERTLIDLTNISDEWKKIFKDAGISKKDLRDSETAKMLLETLERAGINTSSLTGESFSGIGEGEDGDYAPATPSRGPPATPTRGGPPPPPPRTGGGPPTPPPRGGPPAPPPRTASMSFSSSPVAPAPPSAPPPPPRAGAAAPPPPPPSRSPTSGGLLDQIHQGTKLRSASERQLSSPPPQSPSSVSGADLTSLLMGAMATRRVAMKEEKQEEEEDDWDNDEWSD